MSKPEITQAQLYEQIAEQQTSIHRSLNELLTMLQLLRQAQAYAQNLNETMQQWAARALSAETQLAAMAEKLPGEAPLTLN